MELRFKETSTQNLPHACRAAEIFESDYPCHVVRVSYHKRSELCTIVTNAGMWSRIDVEDVKSCDEVAAAINKAMGKK